jgi:hypothetical protein
MTSQVAEFQEVDRPGTIVASSPWNRSPNRRSPATSWTRDDHRQVRHTIGGLLRHLARVEADSFTWKLHGRDPGHTTENDWAWTPDDDPDAAWQQWHDAVERSRALVAEAIADGGLDRAKGHEFTGWGTPSLRRILVDMIEEYARHTGHADLIREAIDGRVGEDAPG